MDRLEEAFLDDDVSAVEWLESILENEDDELHDLALSLGDEQLTQFLEWDGEDDWHCENSQLYSY